MFHNTSLIRRRGFTLVEIMIVAALIALLSGIAIFSINTFYESNIKKATLADERQIITALEFAHQDLQFYPKLSYLRDPAAYILYDPVNKVASNAFVAPSLDYYGYIGSQPAIISRIQGGWHGPYYGMSESRGRSNRGGRSGVTKVRIPSIYLQYPPSPGAPPDQDLSLVNWPADNWGTPYMLYQLKTVKDATGNIYPIFISSPSEDADYFNAVVSYGPFKTPGGNGAIAPFEADNLKLGGLLVERDAMVNNGPALYTMKEVQPPGATYTIPDKLRIPTDINDPNYDNFARTLKFDTSSSAPTLDRYDPKVGRVGIWDDGTDDIGIRF